MRRDVSWCGRRWFGMRRRRPVSQRLSLFRRRRDSGRSRRRSGHGVVHLAHESLERRQMLDGSGTDYAAQYQTLLATAIAAKVTLNTDLAAADAAWSSAVTAADATATQGKNAATAAAQAKVDGAATACRDAVSVAGDTFDAARTVIVNAADDMNNQAATTCDSAIAAAANQFAITQAAAESAAVNKAASASTQFGNEIATAANTYSTDVDSSQANHDANSPPRGKRETTYWLLPNSGLTPASPRPGRLTIIPQPRSMLDTLPR